MHGQVWKEAGMDKIAVHKYEGGTYHPRFGGKAMNYEVVTGPNPLGPRGGRNGEAVDGKVRKRFRSNPKLHAHQAYEAAMAYAMWLAVEEGLDLLEELPTESDVATDAVEIDLGGDVNDLRVRRMTNAVVRPDQAAFRLKVLDAYGGKCCVSGTAVARALQAAHIRPQLGGATNHVTNGVLLRADLHLLFDANLIGIDHDYRLVVSRQLSGTEYAKFAGQRISLPVEKDKQPSARALAWHKARIDIVGDAADGVSLRNLDDINSCCAQHNKFSQSCQPPTTAY